MKQSAKELGKVMRERIRLLASLIARKPASYTNAWAKNIDEAFTLYTRTSTVNFFQALNRMLIELDWPFPAFIDLPEEQKLSTHGWSAITSQPDFTRLKVRDVGISTISLVAGLVAMEDKAEALRLCDSAMIDLFNDNRAAIFDHWLKEPILNGKQQIIEDIRYTYEQGRSAACITATVPLLDHIVRELFGTTRLTVGVQVLRDAFVVEAGLKAKDVMPGSAVWDGKKDPASGNAFAQSLEEDLRLPGIYLSSFFEFADRYYAWYKSTDTMPSTPLNRHAIMHCASEYWTQPNSVRMIVFLDLTLRLKRVLTILVRGSDPAAASGA